MRRNLSIILILTMLFTLVACAQPTTTAPAATTGATNNSNATTVATNNSNATTVATTQATLPPLEIKGMLVQYNQPPDPTGAFWKDMEKKFNVKYTIEWVAESSYQEKQSLVLSTGSMADIMQLISTTDAPVVNAANAGVLMDLTPQLDFKKYPNLGTINASAWMNSKINGKNYVFPRSRGQYNTCLFIRGDWLTTLGMKTPTTIDQLTDYFRGVKTNKTINPAGDVIPLPMEVNTIMAWSLGAFGPGTILPVFTADKSGIVFERLTDSYASAVEWMKKLYDEGLLAKEFALYKTDKNQDMLLAGKGGARHQNVWHRFRLSTEIQKIDKNGYVTPLFSITGPGGTDVQYDIGFYGGHALNAKLTAEKRDRIMQFFETTSDPKMYDYVTFGIEGTHYTMVDGFPSLTELGKKDVTNSFYGPYVVATALFNKVDSPLADAKYNLETREMVKVIDKVAADLKAAPFHIFSIISSNTWAKYWALNVKDFEAYVADTITGKHTIADFKAYQAKIIALPEVQTSFKEFKASYDAYGLATWKP